MLIKLLSIVALLGTSLFFTGCIHRSGGAWMIRSAPTPEGWPELSPVGRVVIREYPSYRAASVSEVRVEGSGMRPMFMSLFDHINRNKIAMTAPVDMGYEETASGGARMDRMAFVYKSRSIGTTGDDGPVVVEDLAPATFASVGVRGDYNARNYEKGLTQLRDYLESHGEWRPAGEPRYLGYNGPLTLWFLRYGEVQVPVEPAP